jgi:hypothetical protein
MILRIRAHRRQQCPVCHLPRPCRWGPASSMNACALISWRTYMSRHFTFWEGNFMRNVYVLRVCLDHVRNTHASKCVSPCLKCMSCSCEECMYYMSVYRISYEGWRPHSCFSYLPFIWYFFFIMCAYVYMLFAHVCVSMNTYACIHTCIFLRTHRSTNTKQVCSYVYLPLCAS